MKFFRKEKCLNGRRHIYFCGIKIASYTKSPRNKLSPVNTVSNPIDVIRNLGVNVDKNVRFIIWPHSDDYPDFGSEPYLISIGDDTCISFGCTFVTHDASIHVCEKFDNDCPKLIKFGKISVGKNCFIGCKSIIMPGVTIGDNCVVGAGSVVTKSIPSGEVWAGHPARFITTIQEYTKKCIDLNTDKENVKAYDIVCKKRKNG